MPQTFVLPRQTILADGLVASGAIASFFETGTMDAQAVYTDAALTIAVTSITADAAGVFQKVYLNPSAPVDYRVRINAADGTLIAQDDDIPASTATATFFVISEEEQAAGLTNADLDRTVGYGDPLRYLAAGDGITDDTQAFINAIAANSLVEVQP